MFWTVLGGALAALLVMGAIVALIMRPVIMRVMNMTMDYVFHRIMELDYTKNPFGVLNVMRHAGPQNFVETLMRSHQGKPIQRPMGSPRQLSPWGELMFQPVYLAPRLPTPQGDRIETDVTIGPQSEKPLRVKIPVLITGMSFGGALSVEAKVALAKGANLAGTATNTGEAYLPEERKAADRLIVQYHRGQWPNNPARRPDLLKTADAIEIQLGQGAQAAAAMRSSPSKINEDMRDVFGLDLGESAIMATRIPGVDTPQDFVDLVHDLKKRYPVPVGVKIGVSNYVEQDLAIFAEAGVDFVTLDGAEGGTHGGPTTLQDDVGLPTLYGLVRADNYLRDQGVRQNITLIAAGQLTSPGVFLKALALGADAVDIGTMAIIALLSEQMTKAFPGAPPYNLVMHSASHQWNHALDIENGAQHLANYLQSVRDEMCYVVQSLGKFSLSGLDRTDLVATSRELASFAGLTYAGEVRQEEGESDHPPNMARVSLRAKGHKRPEHRVH